MAKVVRIFDAAGALRAEVWRGLLARVDSIDCKNHRDWDLSGRTQQQTRVRRAHATATEVGTM